MKASERVFVFGSNLAGVHGAGAAKRAHAHYGAVLGQGEGLHGRSYAIPTKDERIRTMALRVIEPCVKRFLYFAMSRPELEFNVTQVGCGLAGLRARDIAPMFLPLHNCYYDRAWAKHIYGPTRFWTDEVEVL